MVKPCFGAVTARAATECDINVTLRKLVSRWDTSAFPFAFDKLLSRSPTCYIGGSIHASSPRSRSCHRFGLRFCRRRFCHSCLCSGFVSRGQSGLPEHSRGARSRRVRRRASGTGAGRPGGDANILVTGSRIRRPNLDSSIPITSVGPTELTERGDISLGDALNQLPSLRTTFSQANSTAFIGTAGLNQLDLRGQGPSRTLVLVNGRRHVSAVPGQYIVDVNTIPPDLLERVDIVTGGNSAIYGSDAIAGVVNFVLRRDYDGFRIRGQGGVSTYGDRGNYSVSALAGRNFLDNRLNVALALDYAKANTLLFNDRRLSRLAERRRPWRRPRLHHVADHDRAATATSTAFPTPASSTAIRASPSATSRSAAISRPPARRQRRPAPAVHCSAPADCSCTFRVDRARRLRSPTISPSCPTARWPATTRPTASPTTGPIGGGFLGGLSATGVEDAMLLPGLERYSANLLMSGSFHSWFEPFLEAKYVHVTANQHSVQPTFSTGAAAAGDLPPRQSVPDAAGGRHAAADSQHHQSRARPSPRSGSTTTSAAGPKIISARPSGSWSAPAATCSTKAI